MGWLLPGQQRLVVVAGQEVAPGLVLVMLLELAVERDGLAQPPRLPSGLVEVEETGHEEGVVVEVGVMPGLAILEAAPESAVDAHPGEDEAGRPFGPPGVVGLLQHASRARQS